MILMKKLVLFSLSIIWSLSIYSQEVSIIKEKEVYIDPYFNLNTWTIDPKTTYYAYESGVNIMVYTFNQSYQPFHLHFGLLYKEVGFGLGEPNERYSASHLGVGGGISTDFQLSNKFSFSLSTEIFRSFQIHTYKSANVNVNIDGGVRAIQNKTGITLYFSLSPKVGLGLSAKIAPCVITSEEKYGGSHFTGYFVYSQLIDEGWPFYIGSTIRIKL